jgi:heme oxygenase
MTASINWNGSAAFENRERYGRFLQVQHRFHGSLLALYQDEQLNQQLPGLAALSRFAAVEADLRDLGLSLPTSTQPVCVSSAQALGWLYCSEGSNLGAAFLYSTRNVLGWRVTRGPPPGPHPDGRALHWRAFVARLDSLVLGEQEEAEVVAGAIAAFDSYRGHLREVFAGS